MRAQLRSLVLILLIWASSPAIAQSPVQIVMLGYSPLVAGNGAAAANSCEPLKSALSAKGHDISVTNAGTPGDTTFKVMRRLHRDVPEGTDIVILAIGARDLRDGVSPEIVRANTEAIIAVLRAKGAEVVQIGPSAPTMIVKTLPDRILVRFERLLMAEEPTPAVTARLVERTLPVVETTIAKVQAKRMAVFSAGAGEELDEDDAAWSRLNPWHRP